jgi:DNA modification methylase
MLEACWEKAGAFVHQQIIWVKDRGVLTRSHYLWKHEPCFMGWRRPNRPPKVAEETLPSTWALPSFAKDDRPDHPTPKPLDAFGIPMRQHVARGGLCYEPFSGSGSQTWQARPTAASSSRWKSARLCRCRRGTLAGRHRQRCDPRR